MKRILIVLIVGLIVAGLSCFLQGCAQTPKTQEERIAELVEQLEDHNKLVRSQAIWSLARIDDKSAGPASVDRRARLAGLADPDIDGATLWCRAIRSYRAMSTA